ncbi:MAG: penicillin-binding protein 2 [Candidatus Magasanikbacteria bacterium]|nr:penicillin-binding protein 2 [Candidatus Magasanikbacteria bacterium]
MDLDPFVKLPGVGLEKGKMKGKYRFAWIEDSFTPKSIAQSEDIIYSGTSHIGTSFSDIKMFSFLVVITTILLTIAMRLVYIQILEGEEFAVKAEGNRQRAIAVPAERGLIYDRNNIQLTQNIPNFSLAIIPQDLLRDERGITEVINKLSEITGTAAVEIQEMLEKYREYRHESIVIIEDIPYDQALKILIISDQLPGITIQRGSKRLYLTNNLNKEIIADSELLPEEIHAATTTTDANSLSHILGYIGKLSPNELEEYYEKGYLPSDSIGKVGVEQSYEAYMRGIYGERRIEVNSRGAEQSVIATVNPTPGNHLKLSIDYKMQKEMERLLNEWLLKNGKVRASGIAMNPQNGEILALVSIPGFDNNDFSGGIDKETYQKYLDNPDNPLFNRAISGTYPSGSVIKPAMASAALQEGIITAKTKILSTGGIQVGPWFFPDWSRVAHGLTDVRKSISWSVNTFYYYIGGGHEDFKGLGVERINQYLKKYGFGEKLGVDIPGEYEGFLPSPEWKKRVKGEQWYVGDTYNYSIGQGDFLTTPLQIASMTSAIANKGTLYAPRIVRAIIDPVTKEEKIVSGEKISTNIINRSHLETVQLGMKDCIDTGPCGVLRSLPFSVAGKTGTAQWNAEKDTHAWFTSFAPFNNPQIVVTIMLEEGGEGSRTASHVAADFYRWWGKYTGK